MQNIFDYLEWRGDLTFAQDGFNEVDNLIMSALAYLELDGAVPPEASYSSISLSEIAKGYKEQIDKFSALVHNPFFKRIPALFRKAAQSARYRDVKLSNYVNLVDYDASEQFSAVVFSMNPELHFMAFRGTDDTVAGWKEDFHMSFMDEVPAQKQAVIYMNSVFSKLGGQFYLGGHSKGGNLAVYAAAHAEKDIRERIISVYNNDGPGFQTKMIESASYQNICGNVNTLIPKSSIVGMLLEHCGNYEVIASSETGIMQHNAFSWEVKGARFVHEKGISKGSLGLNRTVRAWLEQLPNEERAQFVESLFESIHSTGAKTVGELSREKMVLARAMLKTYKHLDPQTQAHLKKSIDLFFRESRKTLNNAIKTDIDLLLAKRKANRTPAVKKLKATPTQ